MFKFSKKEKGIGIAITLISIMLISVLGLAMVIRSTSLAYVVKQKNYTITALEAAKGGISYAMYRLDTDISFSGPIAATPLSNYSTTVKGDEKGYYSVQITNNLNGSSAVTSVNTGYTIPPGTVEIVSTGYSGNPAGEAKKSVRVVALGKKSLVNSSPFTYAAFGKEGISGGGLGTITDSYDSRLGFYGIPWSNQNRPHGNIGSNGNINAANKTVNGEVHFLNGNTASVNSSTGLITMASPIVLEPMTAPDLMAGTLPAGLPATLIPNKSYGNLSYSGNSSKILTLPSGTYVFSSISISGNASILVLPTDGPVYVYVTGTVDIGGNGITNSSGKPTDLFIYGTGTTNTGAWSIHGNGALAAAVFAPLNDITINGAGCNGEVYGSVIGKSVTFSGANTRIHYDEALSEVEGGLNYEGLDRTNVSWFIL